MALSFTFMKYKIAICNFSMQENSGIAPSSYPWPLLLKASAPHLTVIDSVQLYLQMIWMPLGRNGQSFARTHLSLINFSSRKLVNGVCI
jgi:hypothetical protein